MLRRYTWDKVRDKCQHYKRRAPESSTLYQIVFHARQKLEYCWEERFQSKYGVLRDEVLSVQQTTEDLRELTHKPSSSWARCIKQIYELDPLECPKCKSLMRIIAFIHDPLEIRKIMQSLGLPEFRAPPKIPACPRQGEFLGDIPDYDV